jgi:hypothetical protein
MKHKERQARAKELVGKPFEITPERYEAIAAEIYAPANTPVECDHDEAQRARMCRPHMTVIEAPELETALFNAIAAEIRAHTEASDVPIASLAIDVLAAIRHAGYVIAKP